MTLRANDSFAWCLQSTATGLQFGSPQTFAATSTGAADGTEIPCSTLAASQSANDDLVGYWVECIHCAASAGSESGAPIRRPIVAYDHANKLVHVWALGHQVSSGDTFALLKPPHKWMSEDAGGSQTLISDSTRNEADDALNGTNEQGGYWVEVVEADAISSTTHPLAYNWTNSTHDLSTATSLGASTAIGDLFELWRYPEVDGLLDFGQPRIDRTHLSGGNGLPGGVAGLKDGSGTLNIPFKGPGATRIGDAAEADVAFAALLSTASCSDYTVSSGSTTATIECTASGATAGHIYMTQNGDVAVASSVAGGAITVSPALRSAPTVNQTLYGGRRYTPAELLQYAVSVKQWRGKEVVEYGWGGVPTIQIQMERGSLPKIVTGWQFAHHSGPLTHDNGNAVLARQVRPKTTSVTPRTLGRTRINVGGVEFEARSCNIDLGYETSVRTNISAPDECDGFWIGPDRPTITVEAWLDTDTKAQLHKFISGVYQTVLVQSGRSYGDPGVLAFWAYKAELTGMTHGDESGVRTVQMSMRVIQDRTETTLPRWMIGIF